MTAAVTSIEQFAQTYLTALQTEDLDGITALFAEGGRVHSPLYGARPVREFYAELFANSHSSDVSLLGVMSGATLDGSPLVSVWFFFDWTLSDGRSAPFDVIDVFELDDDGKVERLYIVYDTVGVRPGFEKLAGPSA